MYYKCKECGKTGEKPVITYEMDGGSIAKCEHCGSERLMEACDKCDLCGGFLYESELAYEVGDKLYCQTCVSEVRI